MKPLPLMNWIKIALALTLICVLCECSRKKFDASLLSSNKARIDTAGPMKCFDSDSGYFYLLTFYKTIGKNAGEDFVFESVSTKKESQESNGNIEGDSTKVQYLALYFFKQGGVLYHTKYTTAPNEKYVPLGLTSFDNLYQKDTIKKREEKIEFIRYQPLMQGYQAKKINDQKVVEPTRKDNIKTPKDSLYAAKNRELFNQAVVEKANSAKLRPIAQDCSCDTASRGQPADSTLIKLYLERGGKKAPIYLLGKHQSERSDQEEGILIEQIFYLQEVQSVGGRYIPALLSEVFDLGTETDKPAKPLFWFRLEKKDNFKGNLPNKKR